MSSDSPTTEVADTPRPVVLCILDGWGVREAGADNAIAHAATPVWDRMMAECRHARLEASGLAVGLPDGQMGNSEVGHMNIGAGRVVLQDLPRIGDAIAGGELDRNPALGRLIERLGQSGGVCHLMGLVSPGGVHAHQDQIAALARHLAAAGIGVELHAFLDGRDTPPASARDFLAKLEAELPAGVRIATVTGRYYAMDRDTRWERIERAYLALAEAEGRAARDAADAVETAYREDETDEFVTPTVIEGFPGMRDGDGLLMANFRADRAREILTALLDPDFDGFARRRVVDFAASCGMVGYSRALDPLIDTLFPTVPLNRVLGQVVAEAGLRQLRVAETEKYAHVTFFLNGGEEQAFTGEDRILVPSPKVATYDLEPEMSAPEVTDRLVEAIGTGVYDLIVVNYANPDMVGHTGVMAAAIVAVECIDRCLGRLRQAVAAAGGVLLITADHGNIEQMTDPATGQAHTAHTTNPVPLVLDAGDALPDWQLADGRLSDLAPTILRILKLPQPADMTGRPLLVAGGASAQGTARATA